MLKNVTAEVVTLQKGENVAELRSANVVPDLLASKQEESSPDTLPELTP